MRTKPGRYKFSITVISFSLVIINIIVGRFFAPSEVLISLFLIPIVTYLIIFYKASFNIFYNILLIYGLIALNDIGIRLWGGGKHDFEGQGFMTLFLIINTTFSAILILLSFIGNKEFTILQKIISLALFSFLIFIHLQLFGWLGVDRSY